MRILVIEDEQDIRSWMVDRLSEFSEFEIVGEAESVSSAFSLIVSQKPYAMFSDIKLIGGDLFMLLKKLTDCHVQIPYIVITSGFPDYAIDALNEYHKYVVKYLVKPLASQYKEKLENARDILLANYAAQVQSTSLPQNNTKEEIFIQSNNMYIKIPLEEICWIESAGGGSIFFVLEKKEIKVDMSLKRAIDLLTNNFMQISRDTVINLNCIDRVDRSDHGVYLMRQNKEKFLGVGDLYYPKLIECLKLK
jgi:DNA-binding LytR/AlgR family response regulator